ncbi:MAG: hypothetical protein KZQ83_00515 [gamma proteobacterium symbiont of Taylorina sp.]|nr:hypothetical protein [gamma proteobacterium symbiont of Taylorina sp.]
MAKVGRKAKTINLDNIEELASQGLSHDEVSRLLGMAGRTLYKHRQFNPEVEAAYQSGRKTAITTVANELYERAIYGDTEAMIFFLKCRIGWKEFRHTDKIKEFICDLGDRLPRLVSK